MCVCSINPGLLFFLTETCCGFAYGTLPVAEAYGRGGGGWREPVY